MNELIFHVSLPFPFTSTFRLLFTVKLCGLLTIILHHSITQVAHDYRGERFALILYHSLVWYNVTPRSYTTSTQVSKKLFQLEDEGNK
jgi:hypothetical protein